MRSAELREAAALMRSRALAAMASCSDNAPEWHSVDALMGDGKTRGDAEYIASMSPDVALAVADLLDEQADIVAISERAGLPIDHDARLFRVARTYLGRQS